MTRRLRASFVAVLVCSWATPSLAITPEQKDRVRELVKDGGELIKSGRFSEARDRLLAALELARVPAIALYAASANESLRELDRAAELYRMAIEMPLDESLWDGEKSKTEFQLRSREQARGALRQMLERNATVRIQVIGIAGGDLHVTLDGIALAQASLAYEHPVAPGSHVVAVLQGTRRLSQSVNLDRIEHKTVTFDLTPASESAIVGAPQPDSVSSPRSHARDPAAPPRQVATKVAQTAANESPSRTRSALAWTAYGVGAAGLGVGIVGGLVTLGKRSSLISKGCSGDGACPTDRHISASDVDSYNTWRKVTTVGFIVGAVGTATGVTLSLPPYERAISTADVGRWTRYRRCARHILGADFTTWPPGRRYVVPDSTAFRRCGSATAGGHLCRTRAPAVSPIETAQCRSATAPTTFGDSLL